ncbi:transcriptional regulator NrdR [Xylocopilactobacillus apis]|uniref:Transcriptional repressor NrdR n=1 Tax=Xylocopilactobacillus apis TaxID=2932183 RepID=A0AAU9CR48_9LACO|nr:transcriptional regulator NrdR [Xylocopilactobacillus apis]BDR56392.1 transcriptional repressor NrdR [Xylocopilactobacillus apis]
MKCPNCGYADTRVVDSRPTKLNTAIRRRRQCEKCKFKFTTFEKVESTPLVVVKKNGSNQVFDRNKISRGLVRAAEKRNISQDVLNKIVDEIEEHIRLSSEYEVTTRQIGDMVMKKLAVVDEVAYIRFASVYREFSSIDVFLSELQSMSRKNKKKKSKIDKNSN